MSDFKAGGIPTPDYDGDDINYIDQKTEFSEDVFVYGKLYADLGGDVHTFSTAGVERLRITKDGKVSIGTNNPLGMLEVQCVVNEVPAIISNYNNQAHIQLDAGGNGAGLHLTDTNYFTINHQPYADRWTNNNLIERFRIDTDGQVIFKPMTETERDALTAQAGGVIYNSTTIKLQCYNGTTWNNLFWLTFFIHML